MGTEQPMVKQGQARMLTAGALVVLGLAAGEACGQEPSDRLSRAQQFHQRAQERTGVLIPFYVYPADAETNATLGEVIRVKRQYPTVPMWVIVNPASGPGRRQDPNYTRAIQRLHGAGCVTLGYVTTSYGKRSAADVGADLAQWRKLYPGVLGIFFDEMIYEDQEQAALYQAQLSRDAHAAGYWPTVANPGAETPGRYFEKEAADVIIVHEGAAWPSETRLAGERVGGYADFPPFTRGLLLHSQAALDREKLRMALRYVRWIYVTEAPFRPGDVEAANPWNRVSRHLEETCLLLSRQEFEPD